MKSSTLSASAVLTQPSLACVPRHRGWITRLLLPVALALLAAHPVDAQNSLWASSINNSTGSWSSTTNWSAGLIPPNGSAGTSNTALRFASTLNTTFNDDLGVFYVNAVTLANNTGTGKTLTISGTSGASLVFESNSSGTLPVLTLSASGTGGTSTLSIPLVISNALTMTNTGTSGFTISGGIANNAGLSVTGGPLSLSGTITGAGTILINSGSTVGFSSTNSSYTGATTITSGNLNVAKVANGGVNSSLGAASNVASNLILDGGTLKYVGTATGTNSTDRLFTLTQNGGSLDSSSTGTSTLAIAGNGSGSANAIAYSGSGARTLTLTGTNVNANTFAPVLADGTGGATSLTKAGLGTWVLTGASTYTGTTTVSSGALTVGGTGSLGSTADIEVNSGGAFSVGTGGSVSSTAAVNNNGAVTFNNTAQTIASLNGSNSTTTLNGNTLSISGGGSYGGAIQNGAGTGTVKVTGGSLTLSGSSTYTGGTTVSNSTLVATNTAGSAAGTGAFALNSTGTLAGNGAITTTANNTINGAVQVGYNGTANTTGSLTLGTTGTTTFSGASLAFNLNGASPGESNTLNVGSTGNVFFDTGTTLILNLLNTTTTIDQTVFTLFATTETGGGTLASQSVFGGTGFTWDMTTGRISGLSFNVVNASNPGFYNNSYLFFVGNANGSYNIDVQVVPEPGTWALMLGGFVLLVVFQRSRRSRNI